MFTTKDKTLTLNSTTLELKGIKSYSFQILLVGLAVVLPYIAHYAGAPVRYLLPMHWAVILAGLVYGWRSGAITGLLAPVVSFMISGMPAPHILAPMTIELLIYGIITGLLRENFKMNSFASVAIALIAGRIIFLISVLLLGSVSGSFLSYTESAMLPGIGAVLAQIAILPFIAKWWVDKESQQE
jgi:niacin transporter